MTKPQALPFLVPFAAWFWATRSGWRRGGAGCGLVGARRDRAVLWLPFIPAGGPRDYLGNLAEYQGDIFNVLSLRAWNPGGSSRRLLAGGGVRRRRRAVLGPVTLRHVGYLVTGVLELVVVLGDPARRRRRGRSSSAWRRRSSSSSSFLTTMHERYAYAALVFLVLLLPERRALAGCGSPSASSFTLNLLAAVPPTPADRRAAAGRGALGIAGSLAMIAIAVLTLPSADGRSPATTLSRAGRLRREPATQPA